MRTRHRAALGGIVAVTAITACSDVGTPDGRLAGLGAAFASTPAGYGDLTSSYNGTRADGVPAGDSLGFPGGGRRGHGPGHGEMMGGGLADPFLGGVGFGPGGGHRGPFGGGAGCDGTFDAATGRVTCTDTVRNGLVVVRSARYTDAAGAVQQAFDTATTNTVDLAATVSGTLTFTNPDTIAGAHPERGPGGPGGPGGRDGRGGRHGGPPGGRGFGLGFRLLGDTSRILTATSEVASSSQRTTSGLASGSTQRTVSGTSKGTESITGTSTRGSFTATRTASDTTTGIVVPIDPSGQRGYPTAGTVVRNMAITLTYQGSSPVSLTRREVVTYDGSATAKVEITENGATRSCTRALPRGRLECP